MFYFSLTDNPVRILTPGEESAAIKQCGGPEADSDSNSVLSSNSSRSLSSTSSSCSGSVAGSEAGSSNASNASDSVRDI